ncbi:ATP-binding protein [Streptomyces hygroscopicus]|uniref:ATP-binding protein n=1 Tax=Streptomyces hygroscopicus TaxID=1912 RepID=UPI00099E807E
MSPATALAPIAAEARPKVKRAFEVAITPDSVRVAHIRRITSAYMRFWGVPTSPADDVVLAVSELVTNAVEHGRGDVDLRVRHTGEGRLRAAPVHCFRRAAGPLNRPSVARCVTVPDDGRVQDPAAVPDTWPGAGEERRGERTTLTGPSPRLLTAQSPEFLSKGETHDQRTPHHLPGRAPGRRLTLRRSVALPQR